MKRGAHYNRNYFCRKVCLALAEALEQRRYEVIESRAANLGLGLQDVNADQLEALRWAESLTSAA